MSRLVVLAALAVALAVALFATPAPAQMPNAPPTITLTVTPLPLVAPPNFKQYRFSGRVTDEVHTGLLIVFAGPPGVNGIMASVQSDGTWSVDTTAYQTGPAPITATVFDRQSQSATATATLP